MGDTTTLMVPKDLAEDLAKLAVKDYPSKKWSAKARELLYSYVAMHRGRGNID